MKSTIWAFVVLELLPKSEREIKQSRKMCCCSWFLQPLCGTRSEYKKKEKRREVAQKLNIGTNDIGSQADFLLKTKEKGKVLSRHVVKQRATTCLWLHCQVSQTTIEILVLCKVVTHSGMAGTCKQNNCTAMEKKLSYDSFLALQFSLVL